jgi:signal transduction histidine kinase
MRSVTDRRRQGHGLAWARHRSTASLTPSLRAHYHRFVADFPLGLAVLHLEDPQDPRTWAVVAVNTLASLVVGSTAADFLSVRTLEKSRQRDAPDMAQLIREIGAGKSQQLLGHIGKGKAAPSVRTYALAAFPMAGNCVGFLLQDETLLRTAVKELMEARQYIRQVCVSVRAILWRADPETLEFRHVTKEAQLILGYWIERWYKEANFWKNRVHPDDWDAVKRTCERVTRDGIPRQFECRMTAADSSLRWFRVLARRIVSPVNRVEIAGVMAEITEQKRIEATARKLSTKMLQLRDRERNRIALELHAGITQYLTAIQLNLDTLQTAGSRPPAKAHQVVEDGLSLLTMCMAELRNLSYLLHPPLLEALGLTAALESYLESFALRSGFAWRVEIAKEMRRVSSEVELIFFRTVQECMSKVYRHVRAGSVTLRLTSDADNVVLVIEDDAVGPSPEVLADIESDGIDALGIRATKQRIQELGGLLEICPGGAGTKVRASLPKSVALGRGQP